MPLPPLAIFHGDDDFAIAERLAELKAALGDPSLAALSIAELDGRALIFADLRGVCDTLPFLTARRLVIVRGLLARLIGKPSEEEGDEPPAQANADFAEKLIEYFGDLPPTTALVLVESKPLNERSRLLKAAAGAPNAQIKKFDVPQGPELVRWIIRRAKASGGEFAPAGAEALAAAVGDEPRLLSHEIDKLLAYVNWERPVGRADVERLTPASGEAVIWDLVDALGGRNGRVALEKFHTLLAMPGQDQFAIFGMIVRQFRHILQAKEITQQGGGPTEVMQALGLKSAFPAEKVIRQANAFSLSQLEAVYHRLLEVDLSLKLGGSEDTTTLDTFIASLTA
ncbi:MAG: DNA polymerase III subunit delta [Chloroflexi bacterium]|nr:DNA polymerase III subunit delta [Chloroflexota bacterium]